jgi:ferritin-like metal-binding protein YciE
MSSSHPKVVQYLNEAHATEIGLIRVLQSQIAMTPRGSYRDGLQTHLRETRDHAKRVEDRLAELDEKRGPTQLLLGVGQGLISQALALSKTPLDLLRGSSGEEKVLKNAKDAAATEALEIATYTALERLAEQVGDDTTAALAASIRGDEERMLERVMRELPRLANAVVESEVNGNGSYDLKKTGVADAARNVAAKAKRSADEASDKAKSTAREARKVPGVAQAEGQIKGAVASAEDLPIARYDELTAEEIRDKLPGLSQIDLAKVDSYERKHDNRTTVLSRITSLRTSEPWPGYDELTVSEIQAVLREADEKRLREVTNYERAHKNRSGVLSAAEREVSQV